MIKKWPAPYPGAHWLDAREERAVVRAVRRRALFRYYGLGRPRCVAALEAAARRFYGVHYALAISGGTGALTTALQALGIGPGCEVIVPAFLWVATVGAVVQAGAIPVLGEVDDSYTLDPVDLERRITSRTRLVLVVHMAGAVADMASILSIARRHHLPVLEDCAQANGGSFRGRRVGTFGAVGMFSLQWNKNATAGEGGLLITQDRSLAQRLNAVHDLGVPWVGQEPALRRPAAVTWGQGRRMGELAGAVATVQLAKLPGIIRRMRASKRRIKAALAATPGVTFRRLNDAAGDTGAFLIVRVDSAARARRAARHLRTSGIESACRLADYGMHVYSNIPQLVNKVPLSPAGDPWFLAENAASSYEYGRGACPRSDALFERSILIPIPSCLTRAQEQQGARVIRHAFEAA